MYKLLKCLHPYNDLCREKCPQLCTECDAAQISECFLGGKSKPDARFIQLEDVNTFLKFLALIGTYGPAK